MIVANLLFISKMKMKSKIRHIAFIMDGNGRWAQSRGLPRSQGHKAGFERIVSVLEACMDLGIEFISVFAWSTENWSRPKAEVDYIMTALVRKLPGFAEALQSRGIRFRHIGCRDHLKAELVKTLSAIEEQTRFNRNACFNFAFNYGSRAEIVDAVRKIIKTKMDAGKISEHTISKNLWTESLPDVDILVRTGKEKRISNFFMWQSANAAIHFLDIYWPDITGKDIEQIVRMA